MWSRWLKGSPEASAALESLLAEDGQVPQAVRVTSKVAPRRGQLFGLEAAARNPRQIAAIYRQQASLAGEGQAGDGSPRGQQRRGASDAFTDLRTSSQTRQRPRVHRAQLQSALSPFAAKAPWTWLPAAAHRANPSQQAARPSRKSPVHWRICSEGRMRIRRLDSSATASSPDAPRRPFPRRNAFRFIVRLTGAGKSNGSQRYLPGAAQPRSAAAAMHPQPRLRQGCQSTEQAGWVPSHKGQQERCARRRTLRCRTTA